MSNKEKKVLTFEEVGKLLRPGEAPGVRASQVYNDISAGKLEEIEDPQIFVKLGEEMIPISPGKRLRLFSAASIRLSAKNRRKGGRRVEVRSGEEITPYRSIREAADALSLPYHKVREMVKKGGGVIEKI